MHCSYVIPSSSIILDRILTARPLTSHTTYLYTALFRGVSLITAGKNGLSMQTSCLHLGTGIGAGYVFSRSLSLTQFVSVETETLSNLFSLQSLQSFHSSKSWCVSREFVLLKHLIILLKTNNSSIFAFSCCIILYSKLMQVYNTKLSIILKKR